MPHDRCMELALYRLETSKEMLDAAQAELKRNSYRTANNRAYYAIFHGMRAVLALDQVDFKHHSGIISYFNQHYIATDVFPKQFSGIIKNASLLRNSSDYDDFYICSVNDTIELVKSSELFVSAIDEFVRAKQTQI